MCNDHGHPPLVLHAGLVGAVQQVCLPVGRSDLSGAYSCDTLLHVCGDFCGAVWVADCMRGFKEVRKLYGKKMTGPHTCRL